MTYKYKNRTYKYTTKKSPDKYSFTYYHTFHDGTKEMFVFESGNYVVDGEVDAFIDRYIIRVRKDKLDKINERGI